jgi:hypothetical protein
MSTRALPAVSLGVALARRGALAKVSIGIGVFTTFAMIVATFVVASRSAHSLRHMPSIASSALAWGAGVMLAFGASVRALRHDRDDGVRALWNARGGTTPRYVVGRVAGILIVVALVVAGGTLIVGAAATSLAGRAAAVRVAGSAGAALVHALAFSITVAPVALASLGARSRVGGYLSLVTVLVLPEIFSGWTARTLPSGWEELTSIPSALGALRNALTPGGLDAAMFARAFVVLGAVTAIALAIVRTQVARVDAEAP